MWLDVSLEEIYHKYVLSVLWFASSQQQTHCWMPFRVYTAIFLLGGLSSCIIIILYRAGKVKTKFFLSSDAALLLWWSYQMRANEEIGGI